MPHSISSLSRLVILISGRGSNMQQIVLRCQEGACRAQVVGVISNSSHAEGLAWARTQGLDTIALDHHKFNSRLAFDQALAEVINAYQPDYILMAGFMRILSAWFVSQYVGKLINIHPSLLPAFPGMHTHNQALRAGVCIHGCTVHFVNTQLDQGPIIAQACLSVLAQDNVDTLSARVLSLEHKLYPRVVSWLVEGRVLLNPQQQVSIKGNPVRLLSNDDYFKSY